MKQRTANPISKNIGNIKKGLENKKQQQPPEVNTKLLTDATKNIPDGSACLFSYSTEFYDTSGSEGVIRSFQPVMLFSIYDGFNIDDPDYKYPNGSNFSGQHNVQVENWWEKVEGSESQNWTFKLLVKNDTGGRKSIGVRFILQAFMPDSYFIDSSATTEIV